MKVSERDSVSIQQPQSGKPSEVYAGKSQSRTAANAPSTGEDQVALSANSQLKTLAAAVGSQDSPRSLDGLRALVNSGNYQVDFNALSDAIVGSMLRGY